MVLFFGLVFSIDSPTPRNFSTDALGHAKWFITKFSDFYTGLVIFRGNLVVSWIRLDIWKLLDNYFDFNHIIRPIIHIFLHSKPIQFVHWSTKIRNNEYRYTFFLKAYVISELGSVILAAFDFEAHIMLSLCLNSNVAAKGESIFSDFYWFLNLIKREDIALVLLTNTCNSSGLIIFKAKL